MLRAGALAFAMVGGSLGFGLVSAPSAVAVDPNKGSAGFCPTASGVTVVIDFQELGGTTIVRCAPGGQATGLTALKNAGIQIAGTNRWGESFICRVEGKPGPSSEPCIDTPPASAYWAYWHSPNGGNWSYSQWGVTNRKPPPGSFEGWSFSKDKTENTAPPPRVAPTRPSNGGGSGGSSGGGSGGGSTSGGGNGGASGGSSGGGTAAGGAAASGGAGENSGGADGGSGADDGKGDDKTDKDDDKKDDKDGKGGKDGDKEDDKDASDEPLPGADKEPTEASDWTGEGEDSQAQPTSAGRDIPMGTAAGIGAVALLLCAAGVTAWRRRAAERESGNEV